MKRSALFLLLFLGTLFLRIPYFVKVKPHLRYTWSGQVQPLTEMERAGRSLAHDGTIADVLGDGTGPSAHIAPLYPCLLAIMDRLSGFDTSRYRFSQAVAAALITALFVAILPALAARARMSPGVGTAAAILAMCSPFGLWYEVHGDWEAAFVPIALAGALWAMMAASDQGWADLRSSVVCGFALGVGTLLSPVVLLAGLLGMAGDLIAQRARSTRALANVVVVVTILALTLSPWIYRNYRCFSAFIPTRGNFGLEFAVGNHDDAIGTTWGTSGTVGAHPTENPAEVEKLKAMGEVAYNRMKSEVAWEWVRAHPTRFADLTLRRTLHFWFPHEERVWGSQKFLPVWLKTGLLGALTILAFGGLAWLFVARHPYRFLLAAFFLAPSIPYSITHVFYRYRHPIAGFMYLLACEFTARAIFAIKAHSRNHDLRTNVADLP